MNSILNIGKYLYAIPFAVFGIFHFMNAKAMAGIAFNSTFLVYLSGAGLILATISMLIGKWDKLATTLLALFLLLTALLVQLPGLIGAEDMALQQAYTSNLLKDLALCGGAMMYARYVSKDNAVIGG
jgi:putative oxidoreductase